MARSRRSRSPVVQPVATAGVAFNDSLDSHRERFLIPGAATFSATRSVPRDGVRRLSRLDLLESVPSLIRSGYGADQPHVASGRLRRRSLVVARPAQLPHPFASQRAASWREFQRLRVRVPARVRFCSQRLQRRQVLFATGVGGRRGAAPGPYRRRPESAWSC